MLRTISAYHVFLIAVLLVTGVYTCNRMHPITFTEQHAVVENSHNNLTPVDLATIRKKGKITALTENSSTSYFIYKGMPMGYEYELLAMFADHLGVDLEIKIVEDMDKIFEMLNKGTGDIVAANITVTKERSKYVNFTQPLIHTRQVLVQRLPENWRRMPWHRTEQHLIRNPIDLVGREVHVRKRSSFYSRLKNLSEEVGGDIHIVEVPGDYETEHLIELVAKGKVQYTIADENVAMINKTYFPDIDVETAVSFPQKIAWAVRKNSPDLLNAIDLWIKAMQKNPEFNATYSKYFKSIKAQRERVKSDFSSLNGGSISPYDSLIKQYSMQLHWDWRLLAAQICQESRFDPEARAWTGAYGLMQLLPQTSEELGFADVSNPEDNIKAGTQYLQWINKFWEERIFDRKERIKFVLASYNVGLGHVIDARKLADKYGSNPDIWENNVAEFILLKSKAEYYNDPVVEHGYCRGSETYNYVKHILQRYEHYKRMIS